MSGDTILQDIIDLIARDPHAAPALTLYALVSTLEFPKAGHLFRLDKLKDLDPGQRRLAYGLLDMMADDRIGDTAWQAAKAHMDELVRQG
jgi:hypothetical protein